MSLRLFDFSLTLLNLSAICRHYSNLMRMSEALRQMYNSPVERVKDSQKCEKCREYSDFGGVLSGNRLICDACFFAELADYSETAFSEHQDYVNSIIERLPKTHICEDCQDKFECRCECNNVDCNPYCLVCEDIRWNEETDRKCIEHQKYTAWIEQAHAAGDLDLDDADDPFLEFVLEINR